MNLRQGNGKVPIWAGGETPWRLVEWPTRKTFDAMWGKSPLELVERYWVILKARSGGSTLAEAGGPFNLTRERVRQIEARFQRLMQQQWQAEAID
jgi:hypothetical protein